MDENKTWIDYRIQEMEEKAGAIEFPERDMDGSRFQPEEWPWENEDAYFASISYRMGLMMGIVNPYEDDIPERLRRRVVGNG